MFLITLLTLPVIYYGLSIYAYVRVQKAFGVIEPWHATAAFPVEAIWNAVQPAFAKQSEIDNKAEGYKQAIAVFKQEMVKRGPTHIVEKEVKH